MHKSEISSMGYRWVLRSWIEIEWRGGLYNDERLREKTLDPSSFVQ